ncbi:MAG TPA: GNAT family N-acetyltransferase [Solirubrobacteraceae bacterium]|nr:GNAT family N-acetyltransferase [Solirubrobacteraceae bacterium]
MTATTSATLTDGREARLRPLRCGDRERIVAAFDRLSEESRYRRFFAPLHQLSDRSLEYLTDIDHSDHEAIIALDPGTDELIGVARYVRGEPHGDRAEAAVVVADDWQHVGLGRALLERLVARARAEGISRFTAIVQADNRRALELLAEIGPTSRSLEGNLVELDIELPDERVGTALAAALRAAAGSIFGVRPLSERLLRAAHELSETRRSGP